MTAISSERGWPIKYVYKAWIYSDTLDKADGTRSCKRCGRKPTKDGHDACIGHVLGKISMCCGHGVDAPIDI